MAASPKQMSKKILAVQAVIAFSLCFFLVSCLRFNVSRYSMASECTVDNLHLCRSSQTESNASAADVALFHQQHLSTAQKAISPLTPAVGGESKKRTYPYTIVTASSANHLCALENFLYSLQSLRSEVASHEFPRIVVYNIGMNRTQLPVLDQLVSNGLIDNLVTFDFFKYPRFWDVAINAGEYAWKTGIVHEARRFADQDGGIMVWLDAGNLVTADFLRHIPNTIREHGGFWSPRSMHNMGRLTHPGMFDYYHVKMSKYAKKANCNGAAIGFDTKNQTIVDTIITPWYECGLNKRCIAPPGSSRANHRQDQAALTFLAYRSGHSCRHTPVYFHKLQVHRDISCRTNLLELQVQGLLAHPSSIDYPTWYRSDTLELYSHPDWRYKEDEVPQHIQSLIRPPLPTF